MFDDPRDVNRGLGNRDPYQYGNMPCEGSGYALPIALLAIVVIIGGLIAFAPTHQPADREQRSGGHAQCAGSGARADGAAEDHGAVAVNLRDGTTGP